MKTIKDYDDGQMVGNGDGTYSQVKRCVHGKRFYAFAGSKHDLLLQDYTPAELDKVDNEDVPNDIENDLIPCCG